jgi:outer membrane receptor protein involved in Fe transport
MNLQRFLGATALVGVLAALPSVAQAKSDTPTPTPVPATAPQTDPQSATPDDNAPKKDEIIITGSRIARPTLSSPVPITTVSAGDLLSNGQLNVGDALNNLPALRSTFSQANSTRFIGTSALNLLDLRGLGTARTLVLVNGRRHVTASPGDYLVDTNTIPDDLLERVDIVTGGSSAVYGSDAVAGVVNFVLKRNFTGLKISGQGGISSRGDRGSYFGSISAGTNFAGGRGNIAVSGEYSKNNALYLTDRDDLTGAFSGRNQFNTDSNSAADGVTGSDGIIDQHFYRGVRNGTISDGGELTAICPTTAAGGPAAGSILVGRCRASRVIGATANNAERYMFMPDGSLVQSKPTIDFRDITNGLSSNTVGGLGSTLNNTGQLDPALERISVSLLAHFDVSPAFKPFVEAKFVRINANQEGQPSFFQGSLAGFFALTDDQFAAIKELRCNNPFLSNQALQTLQSIGRCANPATGLLTLSRFNVDFGGRGEQHRRDTFRIVGGVEGTFNEDWRYEVAVNYGQLDTHMTSLNNLKLFDLNGNLDGFLLAEDAVVAPVGFSGSNFATGANGQKVICGINAGVGGNVRPDCVPINLFGSGAPSAAALRFINTTATRVERATELDITANITGDFSQIFSLPGGPIAFNIGTEYRRETARSVYDALTQSGGTFLNAIQPFLPPALEIKEAFAEINIPILKDLPFAEELTISGAGRVSDYNNDTGTVWTYNVSGIWAPIKDLRFRAGYSKSVRAPTQTDLYSPLSQNFAFVGDPCDLANINTGSSTRAANCAAAGVPVGFVNTPARTQTLSYLDGGNSTLTAETSNSWTYGAVLTPRFVPGLVLTVDYYNINVKNLIASLGLQTILNQCYDAATLANQYCALLNPRNATTHEFATPYVGSSGPVNFAKQQTRGLDVDLSYTRNVLGGRLSLRGIGTYVFEKTNYLDPIHPNVPDRQLSELGDPQFEAQASVAYESEGGFSLRYQARYIGKMTIGTYEAQHSFDGKPPQNADLTSEVWYPATWYHNVRLGATISKKYEFYAGVDNLFDTMPPFLVTGTGAGSAIYDNVGRFFYAGFKLKFR